MNRAAALIFTMVFIPGLAQSQTQAQTQVQVCPDASLAPYEAHSVLSLEQPQTFPATVGKSLEVSDCEALTPVSARGYFDAAPSFRLQLREDQAGRLTIGGRASCDATLLLQGPNGQVYFDDDSGSALQPLIQAPALGGDYAVWLGQYDPSSDCTGQIVVALEPQHCPMAAMPRTAVAQTQLNLTPETLADALTAGLTLPITAGGDIDWRGCADLAATQDLDLLGFGPLTPQVDLTLESGELGEPASEGELTLRLSGPCDTSLLALDSAGTWHFNDDFDGDLAPTLSLPLAGLEGLKVWAGAYQVAQCAGELTLTLDLGQDSPVPCPDPTAAPLHRITPGDQPIELDGLLAGGGLDIASCDESGLSPETAGFFSSSPHLSLIVADEDRGRLDVTVTASCDATLLAQDPAGTWHFNDDASGTDPALDFDVDNLAGEYRFWLGTYEPEADCTAGLKVERTVLACPDPRLEAQESYAYGWNDLIGGKSHPVIAGGYTPAELCFEDISVGTFVDRPDFAFDLDLEDQRQLRIYGEGECDTVLLVRAPDGTIYFNDDGGERSSDSLVTTAEGSGRYLVWLGTYGTELCEGRVTLRRPLVK